VSRYILTPAESRDPHATGGKAAALAALRTAGVDIPPWFVVTPAAFEDSVDPAARARLTHGEPAAVGPRPNLAVRDELRTALARLTEAGGSDTLFAVRSSAVDEDGAQHSAAGQLASYLDVPAEDVPARVADVWRSGYGERWLAYRQTSGFGAPPCAPAVIVQRMVRARRSGVAFSADAVTGRRGVAIVTVVEGLGEELVSGAVDGQTFRVDRAGAVIERPRAAPLLDDAAVRTIADLARTCERRCGRPQDVEWAADAERVYLLQSRPITGLAHLPDPDGMPLLWDNSNIAESYGGTTTPLTFSFALHVYEEVYRQLCRVLGAPSSILIEHADTFRHMLGYVRGRVYYNLLSWYRLLALLPGFTFNRRFMEQMMGVKEGLPDSVLSGIGEVRWGARLRDAGRFVLAAVGLVRAYLRLPRDIRRFHARLDAALGTREPDLSALRPDELTAYYRDLERQLITRWDAPLVNDLFAMMFYGTLRKLTTSWCGDAAGTLQNGLLSGEGGIISAEPAARVRRMAELATPDAELVELLRMGALEEMQGALAGIPALRQEYDDYLARFADRCLEELKLESPTLRDDPLPLLRSVGHLAARLRSAGAAPAREPDPDALRPRAEARVRAALRGHLLRQTFFAWVLRSARRHVRDRENLRFERTRVFGRVRRIFVELGLRFWALDALDDPRDIFFLTVDEALGYVDGTATCTDLAGLARLRRATLARERDAAPPAERFETRGAVYAGNTFQSRHVAAPTSADRVAGIGCCPGVVRGPVRVIANPRGADVRAGEILVAERTDPGWIMLFPAAAGVVVERGSLLSHSAIVARELGIPTVVAAPGVTTWLRDGDWVELDGAAGTVTRLPAPDAPGAREEVGHARAR
jgi:phosphohistidine swiveling domain-containing protein